MYVKVARYQYQDMTGGEFQVSHFASLHLWAEYPIL